MQSQATKEALVKVLIAVDESIHSERAVRFVAGMHWPGGSRVIVATVMPAVPPPAMAPSDLAEARQGSVIAECRRGCDTVIARSQSRLREAGLSTEGRILEGDAREQLVALVLAERVDLLVLGSRGRSGVARLLLGSVSAHAVTHAPCSVLVVKERHARAASARRAPRRATSARRHPA